MQHLALVAEAVGVVADVVPAADVRIAVSADVGVRPAGRRIATADLDAIRVVVEVVVPVCAPRSGVAPVRPARITGLIDPYTDDITATAVDGAVANGGLSRHGDCCCCTCCDSHPLELVHDYPLVVVAYKNMHAERAYMMIGLSLTSNQDWIDNLKDNRGCCHET